MDNEIKIDIKSNIHKINPKSYELLNKMPEDMSNVLVTTNQYLAVKYQSYLICSKNEINVNKCYEVKCKTNASKYTKECIKQYGPFFAFKRDDISILLEGERPKQNGERWFGWLPLNEIELTEIILENIEVEK